MATSEPPDEVGSAASAAHSQGQPPPEHATTQQGTPISVLDISDTTTHDRMTSETLVKFSSPKSQERMAATDGLVTKTVSQPGPAIPQLILRHPPPPLSRYSTIGVENSAWSSRDFILGAGMIVIQRNTHKVVVLFDTQKKRWFFPRGRKHIGESLEEAALREAYEGSGYRVEFMPLFNPTGQPAAPGVPASRLNIEPMYMTIMASQPSGNDKGTEYLVTWFAGQIPEDAIAKVSTHMPDEQNYQTYLLSNEAARERVSDMGKMVLRHVWKIYCTTDDYFYDQEQGR